jgi:hypothetical protein
MLSWSSRLQPRVLGAFWVWAEWNGRKLCCMCLTLADLALMAPMATPEFCPFQKAIARRAVHIEPGDSGFFVQPVRILGTYFYYCLW